MSIVTQIQRLLLAKSDIINAIDYKGVTVPANSNMDDMADLILLIGGQETEPEISSYIIDQRLDSINPVYKVPEDMILGTAAKDDDRLVEYNGETVYRNVIRRIRANSHIYVGNYKSLDLYGDLVVVNFLQVSDYDKTKWIDNTTITADFSSYSSDSYYWTWFMKLPEFWWKIEELETDLYKVSFTMTEPDSSWKHWAGNTFIGVYKSGGNIYSDPYLVSRPNLSVCSNVSWNLQLTPLWGRANKARSVSYKEHQIMALLGMGWYGSTDVTRFVGNIIDYNESSSLTGMADSFGMLDTIADFDDTKLQFNNFWGLENWIGGNYEILPDLSCNVTSTLAVVNFYSNPYNHTQTYLTDSVTIPLGTIKAGCITKLKLGTDGYVLPTNFYYNSNYNRCYANFGGFSNVASDIIATRSSSDSSVGGLTYINFKDAKNLLMASMRYVYEGNYHIVNSVDSLINDRTPV